MGKMRSGSASSVHPGPEGVAGAGLVRSGKGLSACLPAAGHSTSCRTANVSEDSKTVSEEEQTSPCDSQR